MKAGEQESGKMYFTGNQEKKVKDMRDTPQSLSQVTTKKNVLGLAAWWSSMLRGEMPLQWVDQNHAGAKVKPELQLDPFPLTFS